MNLQESQSLLQLSPDNPWPGLRSFDEGSKAFFFGRHAETDALLRLVRRETLTLFYGRSGLGKTSLLQAGLFPRLRESNFLPIAIRLDYGPKAPPPVSQVKRAVSDALCAAEIDACPPVEAESLWEYFHRSEIDFWDSQNRLITLVLVFDQFEERFTLGRQLADRDAEAEIFLTELSQLIENRPPPLLKAKFEVQADAVGNYDFEKHSCKVILGLREDFLAELENLRDRFPSVLENALRLQGMSEAQALEVVLRPGSLLVSAPVATEIVRFVAGADQRSQTCLSVEPVLLSVVLSELNERRWKNQQATITSDLLSGSREEILDGFYENALADLPAQTRVLVEDGLLTCSGRRDTLAWEDALLEFGVAEKDVLTLIDRHLLRREDRSDGARIELVHDRLAEIVRKRRDSRREQESNARELADLQARQRELEREKDLQRRKSRRLLVACIALGLFGLVLSGYLVWDGYLHRWRHEAYFSNYTSKNGIFEGIGPLTAEQVSRRSSSLRFIRRGARGPLIRVQAVDGKGRVTHRSGVDNYLQHAENAENYENPARECQWEFVQDETGRIAYELAYDRNANLVWGLAYSPWVGSDHQRVAHFVGPDGLPSSQQMKTTAEYIRIEYWPNGLEKQISYYDRSGKPQIGRDGAYAIRMEYDSQGMLSRLVTMDDHGLPMITENGFAESRSKYDQRGNQVEWACFNTSGIPCLDKHGYAKCRFKYDDRGNEVEWACFNQRDEPTIDQSVGNHMVKNTYDERGYCITWEEYGIDGKRCLIKNGYAKTTAKYDERGNEVEWACFGLRDEPTIDQSVGNHMVKNTYDERGYCITWEEYGVDGKRCLVKNGYAKTTAEYDKRGNEVEWACFGLRDEPTMDQVFGNHMVKNTYDERGYKIGLEYYGLDGKPCLTKNGYAKVAAKYNERGDEIEEAWFDESGNPLATNGVAKWTKNYDENRHATVLTYYDADGKLTYAQIYIAAVVPGGQAEAAGLLVGDVLVSYDGKAVTEVSELIDWVRKPGDALRDLVVSRGGRRMSFEMKPGVMGVLPAVRAVPVPSERTTTKTAAAPVPGG